MHDFVKGHITFSGLVQFHFLFSLPEKLIQSKSIWSLVSSGCVFAFYLQSGKNNLEKPVHPNFRFNQT